MDEETKTTEQKPSGFNPMLLVGILIIVVVVGWVVWASKGTGTTKNNEEASEQQAAQKMTKPTEAMQPTNTMASEEKMFTVQGGSFYFKPNEIRVKKGDKVKITFTNDGGTHDFVLDEFNVKTDRIQSGQTAVVEFVADKAGTFEYYCSVGMHRKMGMKGNLIVE